MGVHAPPARVHLSQRARAYTAHPAAADHHPPPQSTKPTTPPPCLDPKVNGMIVVTDRSASCATGSAYHRLNQFGALGAVLRYCPHCGCTHRAPFLRAPRLTAPRTSSLSLSLSGALALVVSSPCPASGGKSFYHEHFDFSRTRQAAMYFVEVSSEEGGVTRE